MMKEITEYQGKIYDMGIMEGGEHGDPWFYILKDECDRLTVPLMTASQMNFVCDFLKSISSGIHIHFYDYKQFNEVIDKVFRQYCKNQRPEYYFDNTDLKRIMEKLGVTASCIVGVCNIDKNPIGRSTVYDLLEGVTHHPRFSTVCKIQKALFKIAGVQAM